MTATIDPSSDLSTEPLRSRRNHWNNHVRRHAVMTPDEPALTFMGQVKTQAPHAVQRSVSPSIFISENRDVALRMTVMGHTYLQNARLSRKKNARMIPTA